MWAFTSFYLLYVLSVRATSDRPSEVVSYIMVFVYVIVRLTKALNKLQKETGYFLFSVVPLHKLRIS